MILVDTSVWVQHFRHGTPRLERLLSERRVLGHPFVLGELLCGNMGSRHETHRLLSELPQTPVAEDAEVYAFIQRHSLMGRGIGYLDVHLLASAVLVDNADVWTLDSRLRRVAEELSISFG